MPDRKIRAITYNWRSDLEGHPLFDYAKVGDGHYPSSPVVTEIKEHPCGVEGDKWYFDIIYADGTVKRTFNPNEVFYESDIIG